MQQSYNLCLTLNLATPDHSLQSDLGSAMRFRRLMLGR